MSGSSSFDIHYLEPKIQDVIEYQYDEALNDFTEIYLLTYAEVINKQLSFNEAMLR